MQWTYCSLLLVRTVLSSGEGVGKLQTIEARSAHDPCAHIHILLLLLFINIKKYYMRYCKTIEYIIFNEMVKQLDCAAKGAPVAEVLDP